MSHSKTARSGGSQRTEIEPASNSTNDTIRPTNTKTAGSENCLPDPDRKSSCEQQMEMQCLSGGSLSTHRGSVASIARYSETKARTSHQFLSDRLTLSLINAGLVNGITHMSARKRLEAGTPAIVSYVPVGSGAERQKVACLF